MYHQVIYKKCDTADCKNNKTLFDNDDDLRYCNYCGCILTTEIVLEDEDEVGY